MAVYRAALRTSLLHDAGPCRLLEALAAARRCIPRLISASRPSTRADVQRRGDDHAPAAARLQPARPLQH